MIHYTKNASGDYTYECKDVTLPLYQTHELLTDYTGITYDDIIARSVKVISLNTLTERTKQARKFILNQNKTLLTESILNKIDVLDQIIEDALNIQMFKFAFKLLSNSLSKEILTIEKIIETWS